ncbi:TetR/AcrR family transcriptional regulator [Geodermatophilus sp. DSM 44513]|uniref:TetR/AcrR family transcriptional regulator n=1 Tax=Geodermatophilus sp. DSM 44513 TaxID=1528104 RepID=UPI00126E7BDA|nr:TetR/AcrR family transcriptional regulator [Geodermatophilus sp. DSM 44513]WNV75720.1 helix-turn-helix domain-containing protein [Geodermatophilus sp. DSM 44513]
MTQAHRARQYAATHRRIYDAALRLFVDDGYDSVSIARIADAAGVSVPTFYAHYTGKDELVMALPQREEVVALLAAVPADRPFAERLRDVLCQFLCGLPPERRSDALVRWRLIAATPVLRYRAGEFERHTAQLFLDALGEDAERDATAALVLAAYLSVYTQALLRWAESGGERPLEEVCAEALDVLRTL